MAAVSQSAEPSTAPAELKRQVFISHTAADDQGRIFASSILKPALERAGLDVYMDFQDLPPGCEFQHDLVQAAASSAVFVVVLTRSYPTRFWCLRELDLAMHGHPSFPRTANPTIIPVRIDNRAVWQHLNKQELEQDIQDRMGRFPARRDPLEQQDLQYLQQQSQRLLDNIPALSKLQDIRRQHHSEESQQEGGVAASSSRQSGPKHEEQLLADEVAAAAKQQLPCLAHIPDGLVGVDEQRDILLHQLDIGTPPAGYRVLWLYGPGGIGKSTLADLLWNKLSGSFTRTAKISLDLDGSTEGQLRDALQHLLGQLGQDHKHKDSTQLQQHLTELVQRERVLLLFDNINHTQQLDRLLPSAFSSGSRIIVTSRAACPTDSATWNESLMQHSVEGLDDAPSLQLLRRFHRLTEEQLTSWDLLEAEQEVLAACSGLPLALRIIGGSLMVLPCLEEEVRKTWEAVQGFQSGLPLGGQPRSNELQDRVIRWSFEKKLSAAAQNMFLDCITVLEHQPYDWAMRVWEAWWPQQAYSAFKQLQQLSLVNEYDGFLSVPDVIRSTGRSMLLEAGSPFAGSRIWQGPHSKLLGFVQGRSPVGINLTSCVDAATSASMDNWDLSELRVCRGCLPTRHLLTAKRLMWLQRNCVPRDEEYLVWVPFEEKMCSCIHTARALTQSVTGSGNLSNLVVLSAQTEASSIFASRRSLAHTLSFCIQEAQARRAAAVYGAYFTQHPGRNFTESVKNAWKMRVGPLPRWVGGMTSLQVMTMSNHSLTALPESFGGLAALQKLDLANCVNLARLPESFGWLAALRKLELGGCERLARLPESFGNLTGLQRLGLCGCTMLRMPPELVLHLTGLQVVDVRFAPQLQHLPWLELPAVKRIMIYDIIMSKDRYEDTGTWH